jgi:pilus assembly protein Flp/PilA
MRARILRLVRPAYDERGASAVEYGLLVAAIAAVIVAIVFGLGSLVHDAFSNTSSCVSAGAAATC